MASELEMKCSIRNAPMGTMPERECSRRRRNELPSPTRSDGTPAGTWIVPLSVLIGLADEATTLTPYMIRGMIKRTLHYQFRQLRKSRNETLSALKRLVHLPSPRSL